MKLTTFAMSLVLMCLIAAPAAQRSEAPANQPAHNVFVLTGCLERVNAPSAFRLTRAAPVGQAPPQSSAPAAATDKTDDVYELQATSSVSEQGLSSEKLLPDVGARVEVTVRPVEMTSPAPPTSGSTDSAKKPAESPRQRYTVVKINRLANSCV